MGETKQGFNLFKAFADYDRRIIHATMMIVMIIFLLLPLKLPLIVSEQTNKYYNIVNNIKPGDKVLFVFDCEPSGFQELRSGIIATMRMLLEHEAKIAVIIGVPESIALPGIVIDTLQEIWTRKGYEYGKNYVYLGYAWANDASVSASATNWQSAIRKDYYGNPITGTFLKDVNDWKDWALICDFPTAHFYGSIINHYALRGTPLIMNCNGVMIAMIRPQVDIGTVKAYLGSTRGGAELEYILGTYGPGLQSMNAFSVLHYVTIGFVIIGNIGYFMYTKKNQKG